MDDLYKQKKNAEHKIAEYQKRMFALEAKELRKVVEAETDRAVKDARRAEREKYAAKSKARTQNAAKRQYIESITKRTHALGDLLKNNSADKHIPDDLKAPIAKLIASLDFSSQKSLQGGALTKKEIALKDAVDQIKKLAAAENWEGMAALDLPPRFKEQWDEVVKGVYSIASGYSDQLTLERMTPAELRALNRSLMDLQHAVGVANEIISAKNAEPIHVLANHLAQDLDNRKQHGAQSDGFGKLVKDFAVWENLLPVYGFDRLGSVGTKLFGLFQDGFDQLVTDVAHIGEFTETVYTTKEVSQWRKEVHEFECETLAGETRRVYLTTADIMSFYCLSKRTHAIPHFKGGGIKANDIVIGTKKCKNDAKGARLTEKTIAEIIGTLTDRQREVADKLQAFLNEDCSDWGNEISLKRHGFRMFTEANYFPLKTSDSSRDMVSAESPQNTKLYALLNMSFTKTLTEKANNQIVIEDIFEVFANHTSAMARYHSLALPVLDYMRVFNYREKLFSNAREDDSSFEQINVRNSMENALGRSGIQYFESFIANINGANWTEDSHGFWTALGKGSKTAMVGFNMRTVVQQPTAAVRALMYLGVGDMAPSLSPVGIKEAHSLALKYCPMARWKSMGYFDLGTGRGLLSMIAKDETWRDKTVEASMYLAGKADEITWAYLWKACERFVSRHEKGLKKGTEEYYQAVGGKLREVIYKTQVVDSPLTKSKYMSSPSEFKKMTSMFAGEPTVTYNMILEVSYKIFSAKSKKQAWAEHRKQFAKLVGIYATQALLLAAVQAAMDGIRDDDDEPYGEKYLDAFWSNLADELNPLVKLPLARDIVSMSKGFSVSRTDTMVFAKSATAIRSIIKGFEGDVTLYKGIYDVLSAVSSWTGISASNLLRDIIALWNTIIGGMYPELKIKK